MEYFTLNNGVQMPIMGFGTWDVRGAEGEHSILDALEVGYRLIDTAQMYGNERVIGNAIRHSGLPREELFITTKLYSPSTSYRKARAGIEHSLNELQSDYIDLLLIHEPYAQSLEMYQAFKEAYHEGKVKAIGISNFNARLYGEFISSCEIIPAINQVESHVYFPQLELKKRMAENGTQMQAWAPFTEGRRNIFDNKILKAIGEAHEKSAAQIALKYLVQNQIAVIPKSSNKNRMRENISLFDFQLTEEEIKQIQNLDGGKTLFGWY